jgi:multiple sugar transport system substrate-binding protein
MVLQAINTDLPTEELIQLAQHQINEIDK